MNRIPLCGSTWSGFTCRNPPRAPSPRLQPPSSLVPTLGRLGGGQLASTVRSRSPTAGRVPPRPPPMTHDAPATAQVDPPDDKAPEDKAPEDKAPDDKAPE